MFAPKQLLLHTRTNDESICVKTQKVHNSGYQLSAMIMFHCTSFVYCVLLRIKYIVTLENVLTRIIKVNWQPAETSV